MKDRAPHPESYNLNGRTARRIGISNFCESHVRDLLENCRIKPFLNQVMAPILEIKSFAENISLVRVF